jgi:hypothetical protein
LEIAARATSAVARNVIPGPEAHILEMSSTIRRTTFDSSETWRRILGAPFQA